MDYKLDYDSCDVLVIGAGGAGLRAALAAYETNNKLKIIIVTKGEFGRSRTIVS